MRMDRLLVFRLVGRFEIALPRIVVDRVQILRLEMRLEPMRG